MVILHRIPTPQCRGQGDIDFVVVVVAVVVRLARRPSSRVPGC